MASIDSSLSQKTTFSKSKDSLILLEDGKKDGEITSGRYCLSNISEITSISEGDSFCIINKSGDTLTLKLLSKVSKATINTEVKQADGSYIKKEIGIVCFT